MTGSASPTTCAPSSRSTTPGAITDSGYSGRGYDRCDDGRPRRRLDHDPGRASCRPRQASPSVDRRSGPLHPDGRRPHRCADAAAVKHPPFVQYAAPIVWTTLAADDPRRRQRTRARDRRLRLPAPLGVRRRRRAGRRRAASPSTRQWMAESFGRRTPWGDEDSPALVSEVETAARARAARRTSCVAQPSPTSASVQAGQHARRAGRRRATSSSCCSTGVLMVEVDGEPAGRARAGRGARRACCARGRHAHGDAARRHRLQGRRRTGRGGRPRPARGARRRASPGGRALTAERLTGGERCRSAAQRAAQRSLRRVVAVHPVHAAAGWGRGGAEQHPGIGRLVRIEPDRRTEDQLQPAVRRRRRCRLRRSSRCTPRTSPARRRGGRATRFAESRGEPLDLRFDRRRSCRPSSRSARGSRSTRCACRPVLGWGRPATAARRARTAGRGAGRRRPCLGRGDLGERPADVDGAGATAGIVRPRHRPVEGVVDLERAGPCRKRSRRRR